MAAVSNQRFIHHVPTFLNNIYGCYITKYNPASDGKVMLGACLNGKYAQSDNQTTGIDEMDAFES